jgi:hypothetical protein
VQMPQRGGGDAWPLDRMSFFFLGGGGAREAGAKYQQRWLADWR